MTYPQRALSRCYDEANLSLNVTVVAQVSVSDAQPAQANLDENGIWARVFDEATGQLRVVEVLA